MTSGNFALKPYKIGSKVKRFCIFCSQKAACTTIFSNTYIRNRVKNQLCPIRVKVLTNIKENF